MEQTQSQRIAAERKAKAQQEREERDRALGELRALLRKTPPTIGSWGYMATQDYKAAAGARQKVANNHAPTLYQIEGAIRTLSAYHSPTFKPAQAA